VTQFHLAINENSCDSGFIKKIQEEDIEKTGPYQSIINSMEVSYMTALSDSNSYGEELERIISKEQKA